MNCSWSVSEGLFGTSSSTFLPFKNNNSGEDLTGVVLNMKPFISGELANFFPRDRFIYLGIECKAEASNKIRAILSKGLKNLISIETKKSDIASGVSESFAKKMIYLIEPDTDEMRLLGVKRFALWMPVDQFCYKTLQSVLRVVSDKREMGQSALPNSVVMTLLNKITITEEV